MNLAGVVTITDGQINYWPKRTEAIDKLEDYIYTAENYFGEDASKYKPVVEQLRSGRAICTDDDYDLCIIAKAQLALKVGFFI